MAKKYIKAVYFDMGGVLMGVDPEYNREEAIKRAFSGPRMKAFANGDVDIDAFLTLMGQSIDDRAEERPGIQEDAWRVDKEMVERFFDKPVPYEVLQEKFWNQINYMTSCFVVLPEVHDTLVELKERGLKIGLISNVFHPAIIFKELFTKWGIIDFFEPLLFSSDYRFKKPHPAIFEYALSWYPDIPADQVLFIGDTWDIDVVGARNVGMKPIWVNPEFQETCRENIPVIKSVKEIIDILSNGA